MKTLIAASLSAFSLAACASAPTPHEARNAYSEGYTERALSHNRYLVEYRMDGADYQRAYDLALRRAAQLTLQHGYSSFEIVNRDSDTDVDARPTISFSTQHGVAYERSCGLVSCTTRARPVMWNEVEYNNDGRRPSRVVSLEVLMTTSASTSPDHYDAAAILANARN